MTNFLKVIRNEDVTLRRGYHAPFVRSCESFQSKASHLTLKLAKYGPCSNSSGISRFPSRALATLAGTDKVLFTTSSHARVVCREEESLFSREKTVVCNRSRGYAFVKRANKSIEYGVNGRDKIELYACTVTSPAARLANEKASGMNHCSSRDISFSRVKSGCQAGITCSNSAL